jgi:arylsulfatase A-like enzyme
VISLFSGLYPQQHGADGNQEGDRLSIFDEAVPLLPRTLRAAGYRTAGFVTNPFLHEWNPVHRAFDHYDASFIGNQGPTRGHGELVWTERMYADSVNAALLAHYRATPPAGPEFTYVHYIDVHGRAEGPERWKAAPFEPSYAGAARYVDGRIRELYDFFSARYAGELVFVVTSDHGQDLEDDLALGEGVPWRKRKASLHDFNLRVPFYVLPGNDVPVGKVLSAPCANIDVTPTLLEWVGAPPHAGVPGQSLLGALRGAPYDGAARCLYARNSAFRRLEEAVVVGGEKLVRYRAPRAGASLFELARDPREARPVRRESPTAERCLEASQSPPGPSFSARFETPGEDVLRNLEELGYAGEDGEPAPPR